MSVGVDLQPWACASGVDCANALMVDHGEIEPAAAAVRMAEDFRNCRRVVVMVLLNCGVRGVCDDTGK